MSRLKLNILANFAGQAWVTLMGFALVPLYIKFMGIEAYGLVGFYTTLQGIANLLDLGLSPTMNREMARYSTRPGSADEARDLVRTLEVGYWAIGILLGAVVALAAPWVAAHWVKAQELPVPVVQEAVMIMGLVTALQWPLSFYQGGLMGLQMQAPLQAINVGVSTLRGVGAGLILWQVSPTITAFFTWQIVVSAFHVSLITFFLWRSLPASTRAPRFDGHLLRNIWRFAAGMSATALVTLLLTQLDKLILSNLLSLEMFGYYTLAGTVANALYNVISPVFSALFPRFSALVARGDHQDLAWVYHRGCQLMSALILPVALTVCLFARELIFLWTRNPLITDRVAPIASVLIVGTALNGLMNLPYAAQLAYGWAMLAFYKNTIAIVALAPLVIFLANRYGAVGAAATWVILNGSYVLIEIPIMHRRVLKGEMRHWYLKDVGLPLVATLIVAGLVRWLLPTTLSAVLLFSVLAVATLAALLAAGLAAPQVRAWAFEQVARLKVVYGQ